jgi:hypothetical protein
MDTFQEMGRHTFQVTWEKGPMELPLSESASSPHLEFPRKIWIISSLCIGGL